MQYHLIVTLPIFILLHLGLALTFRKAGVPAWKGLVPLYNVYVWLQLVGRPKWWIVFYLVPVLNFVMGIGIILDLIKAFGKHKFLDHALAVIFPYAYFLYLGLNKKDKFLGVARRHGATDEAHFRKGSHDHLVVAANKSGAAPVNEEPPKTKLREWLDAILFAGVAALVIRTFMLEAFMIPTTSMEGSLLAGDFLFVSKVHYGVRMPMAPLSIPFVHNKLPLTDGTKSYLDWITLPYSRLPALKDVKRNEIVVFNYPDDDANPDVEALGYIKVISMKQNYIKRCVAIPGDVLEIRAGTLYINNEPAWKPEFMQTSYFVSGLSSKFLEKKGFRFGNSTNWNAKQLDGYGGWLLNMNEKMMNEIAAVPGVKVIPEIEDLNTMTAKQRADRLASELENVAGNPLDTDPYADKPKNALFPKKPNKVLWTRDDYGPLWIPKKGESIPLNDSTLTFYEKCIRVYEDNTLEVKGGKYYVNGAEATTYTFKMDYYWMMGDNRHQSLDSRYWGFVPEDHIVGRPWFVLFSFEGGPRWDRFFRPASRWEP